MIKNSNQRAETRIAFKKKIKIIDFSSQLTSVHGYLLGPGSGPSAGSSSCAAVSEQSAQSPQSDEEGKPQEECDSYEQIKETALWIQQERGGLRESSQLKSQD